MWEKIDFLNDPWIPTLRDFNITIQKPEECIIKCVKDSINPRTKEWNDQTLQNILSSNKINEIKRIFISENQHEDKIRWQYDKKVTTLSNLEIM